MTTTASRLFYLFLLKSDKVKQLVFTKKNGQEYKSSTKIMRLSVISFSTLHLPSHQVVKTEQLKLTTSLYKKIIIFSDVYATDDATVQNPLNRKVWHSSAELRSSWHLGRLEH